MGTRKKPRRTQGRIQRLVSNAIAAIMVRANEPTGRKRFAWRGKEHGRVVTGVNAAANTKQVHDALLSVGVAVEADGVTVWKAPPKALYRRRAHDRAQRASATTTAAPIVETAQDGDGEGYGEGGNERGIMKDPSSTPEVAPTTHWMRP